MPAGTSGVVLSGVDICIVYMRFVRQPSIPLTSQTMASVVGPALLRRRAAFSVLAHTPPSPANRSSIILPDVYASPPGLVTCSVLPDEEFRRRRRETRMRATEHVSSFPYQARGRAKVTMVCSSPISAGHKTAGLSPLLRQLRGVSAVFGNGKKCSPRHQLTH